MRPLSQPARLAIAAVYVAVLVVLGLYLNATFPPPLGVEGLWFYAALGGVLLGEFLLEPFFTRPADALANGIALALAAAGASTVASNVGVDATRVGQITLIALGLTVSAVAAIAIALKDQAGLPTTVAAIGTALSGTIGSAKFLYSILLLASGFAAFADDSLRLAVLLVAWATIFFGRPLERLVAWWVQVVPRLRQQHGAAIVVGVEEPMLLVVDLPSTLEWRLGDSVHLPELTASGTVVDLTSLAPNPRARIALDKSVAVRQGTRVHAERTNRGDPVIGYVAEGTSIDEVAIRAVPIAADLGLAEGRIVSAAMAGVEVLYQVTGAQALRRIDNSVPRGYVKVEARKLGKWDESSRTFESVPWLPTPGSAVRLVKSDSATQFRAESVGAVPGTAYGVDLDIHSAVTHNTAILGILGVGKTMLAWELVHRLLAEGVKVVVLDITDQYTTNHGFQDIFTGPEQTELQQAIVQEIAEGCPNVDVAEGEAGNVRDFRELMRRLLTEFLRGESQLLVLNPLAIDVSRIDVKYGRRDERSVIGLTAVEITRVISELLLALLRESGLVDDGRARLCLVLEEAHSLVPEWNSTADKIEQRATVGTVRAVLQGRKYGFGCIVVTQRTANVTKSILNQCNTVFAMRIFDATGMEFLENYLGTSHSRLLATLRRVQAVVFGAAFKSTVPLLIDLNQRKAFLEGFWAGRRAAVKRTDLARLKAAVSAPEAGQADADVDREVDDIPF